MLFLIRDLPQIKDKRVTFFQKKKARYTFFVTQPTLFLICDLLQKKNSELRLKKTRDLPPKAKKTSQC